jgi:lipopolysaccharide export system permease protein
MIGLAPMRWPRTLSLYVTREVVSYTLIGLAAIAIVMVARGIVRVLDYLIGAGFALEDLLSLISLLVTTFAIYALPVSFLFGVLLAIGRMASDLEITAMRACGVGIRGLLVPIALLGGLLSLATLALSLEVEPAARRAMAGLIRTMLVRGASVEPGRFNSVGDRTLYVDEREGKNRLRGVLISDRTDPERPFLVFAESGEMQLDEERAELRLSLERGDVHIEGQGDEQDRYQRLGFERLVYKIDVTKLMSPTVPPRPREMTLADLRAITARIAAGTSEELRDPPTYYAMNLERRYALPAAPALFALVGVPLGMQRKRGARSYGAILCALLAFGYYALVSFCESLATEKGFPPRLAAWLPNLAYAAVGTVLLVRARRSS